VDSGGSKVVTSPVAHRFRTLRPAGAAALAAAAAVVLLAGPALAGSAPTVTPWSHYDTGRVNVVFPSTLPGVELIQDANASLTATLELAGIYEINTTASGGPAVVAGAFPESATGFNGTTTGSASGAPVELFANLAIYPVDLGLFDPATTVAPTGAPTGTTSLTLSYSPTTSTETAAGVGINWTVGAWPLAHPGDLLALAFDFAYAAGASVTACRGATVLSVPQPACAGTDIGIGGSVWGAAYTSLEGEAGPGPVAVVSWTETVLYGTAASPVDIGAYSSGAGAARLVVASAPVGSAPARGTVGFALVAPTPSAAAVLLTGDLGPYVGALAGLGAVAGIATVAYRRRERAARAAL